MVVAAYVGLQDERAYLSKRAREAKAAIERFPTVDYFARDLPKLARLHTYSIWNPLFLNAGWVSPFQFGRKDSMLPELENAFRAFKARRWPRGLQELIHSRICSEKPEACTSVISEMDVALTLRKKFKNSVKPYPAYPRRGPDVEAFIRDRPVFFEVTSVGPGKTEEKLLKICRDVAKELHRRIFGSVVLRVEVDTSKLLWNKKRQLLVGRSVQKIVESWDRLRLSLLLDTFTSFDLKDMSALRGMDKDSIVSYLNRAWPNKKGYQSAEFQAFVSSVSYDDLESSPIRSFLQSKGRHKVVEVASHMFFPSDVSATEQDAFLNRVQRAIISKMRHGQLQSGSPNVIALRASNWTLANYELATPADVYGYANPLKDRIRRVMRDFRCSSLSAVMFFENRFQNAWIVGNRFSGSNSRLTGLEYLDLFGRHRVSLIKRLKFAQRIRKKMNHKSVSLCARGIAGDYEATNTIKSTCEWRMFDDRRHSQVKFFQFPRYVAVPKNLFRDPSILPELSDLGRAVSLTEEKYLVDTLVTNSETGAELVHFGYDALSAEIDDFVSVVGEPSAVFIPLDYFVDVHQWLDLDRRRPRFEYFKQQMYLLKDELKIPVHWLRDELLHDCIIIYNKRRHGEWIFKPGNLTDTLTFELKRNCKDKNKVNLLVKSVGAYVVSDRNAARKIPVKVQRT